MPPKKPGNTQNDAKINSILSLYSGANFADILNRLWMNGAKVADLEKVLSKTKDVGDNPYEIVQRLLQQGLATEEQLRAASTSFVPPNANQSPWPFRPESINDKGLHIAGFKDDSAKFYPDAARPTLAPAPNSIAAQPVAPAIQDKTVPSGNETKEKKPETPAEILQYEKDHYGNMMWVKNDPGLNQLLESASRNQWTPEKFKAEFENSDWYKTKLPQTRAFTERQLSGDISLNKEIDDKTNDMLASATAMGFNLTYQDLLPLATDGIRLGWTDLELKKAVLAKVQFDPNQSGGLGALGTKAKEIGKNYLFNISAEEANDWSRKLFTGEASEESMQQAFRLKAKSAFPSLAEFIDNNGVPKDYFAQHVTTAANLLEVSEGDIDLTDSKYNQIISHADEKGNLRPMSVYETTKFIKGKDEYWKTSNSANEVSQVVNQLGALFGKTAV